MNRHNFDMVALHSDHTCALQSRECVQADRFFVVVMCQVSG